MTSDEQDGGGREARNERYKRVLSTIDANTGGPQLPGCSSRVIRLCLIAHGSLTNANKVEQAIRATVKNGDCIKWVDRDGTTRYTRTRKDDLQLLIGHENKQDAPREELIQEAVAHIGVQQ